jgi:integrase
MRGSVVRRGKSYYVKIELDPDPITGKRRQKWHSGFRTRRDAERARIDLLSKFDRGEYVEPTHQSLGEFLAEWLRTVEPTLRPGTFDSYSRNVHNHVVSHIGSMRLTKVDAGALNGLYATLLASGRRPSSRRGKGYSPEVLERALELRAGGTSLKDTAAALREEFEEASHISKDTVASLLRRHAEAMAGKGKPAGLDPRTVNYVHTILHRAFRDAVRWGRLARNPADAADPPRGQPKSDAIKTWDAGTLKTFLATTKDAGDRLYPLWVLLATTGMRRGEALGLRWSDVDLDAGRAHLVQTIISVRGKVSVGEPKTLRGRRPIALDPSTVAVLKAHRKTMLEERLQLGEAFTDEGLVFHRPDGHCLRPEGVSDTFKRTARRLGLTPLTLKGLRHTWATLALEKGIHPRVVQERLGHSTIAITLGIYSHVAPTLHDEAAELVADLIL